MFGKILFTTVFNLFFVARAGELFALFDTDASGTVSPEEAAVSLELAAAWGELDEDGDGRLSKREFTRFEPSAPALNEPMEMSDRLSEKQ